MQMTPFLANCRCHPRFSISARDDTINPIAEHTIHENLILELQDSKERSKLITNQKRNEAPFSSLGIRCACSKETLLPHNLVTNSTTIKPLHNHHPITRVAFHLQLVEHFWIHVFRVSLFEPYMESSIPGRVSKLPPPTEFSMFWRGQC